MKKVFGLLGFPLSHSFSQAYFSKKFADLELPDYRYDLFSYQTIDEFYTDILLKKESETEILLGFNVTIPYKIAIIDHLDDLDDTAKAVGAVNTVLKKDGKLIGFNTDISLPLPSIKTTALHALLLGTGGASRAVAYALKKKNIPFQQISRQADKSRNILSYDDLKGLDLIDFQLIINATPVGMYPNIAAKPDLNYTELTENHFLYDLVYNPTETAFLREGIDRNCMTQNGLAMLYAQAEAAWEIWNRVG
ncbi:MAG: hypothetical protein RI894_921 [Bacteroidota bacterium]|jgi:shikimate dehydrogenase